MPDPAEVQHAEEKAREFERRQEQARRELEELRRKQKDPKYQTPVSRKRARD